MDQSIETEDIEVIFNQKAVPINFYGDKMVFLMDEKTYLSNLDGTDKKVLFDDYESVMMTKNYIFIDTMFGVEAYDYAGHKVNLFE